MSYNIDDEAKKVIKILEKKKRSIKDDSFILNFFEMAETSNIDKSEKKKDGKKLKYPQLNRLFGGDYDDKLFKFFREYGNLSKNIIINCFALYGTKNLINDIADKEQKRTVQVQDNNINANNNSDNEQIEEEIRNELETMANDLAITIYTNSQKQFAKQENRLEAAQKDRTSLVGQVIQVHSDSRKRGSIIKFANEQNLFITVDTEANSGRTPTMIERENENARKFLQERQAQLNNLANDIVEQSNPSKVQDSDFSSH